ncbi:alpha/beta hydrolase [soil metagenome]
MTSEAFFGAGFRVQTLSLDDATIHFEVGGNGPPLLLLHGYPQTHVAWHRVAPTLAEHFTVVAPDLRGYGDSLGPQRSAANAKDPSGHERYAKRVVAQDMLSLMQSLGFAEFAVMGHDRGGRVGYRLAMDHPQAVTCFVSVTVIPTEERWKRADMAFGMKTWHWYMFAQPYDLPERLLRGDPQFFLDWTLDGMLKRKSAITPQALAEYHRAFARESVRHAMMEDYRAGATIDLEHDRADSGAGRRLACPMQIVWNESDKARPNPQEIWQQWADRVEGGTIDCGHLMAEEAPDELLALVLPFLLRHSAAIGHDNEPTTP